MKAPACVGLHVVLCLWLAPNSVAREDKPAAAPLAHFRFDGKIKNEGKGEAEFELRNTEFKKEGLYLNGKSENVKRDGKDVPNAGFRAICTTPKMDCESFAVALRFKAESFDGRKTNLITGGRTDRWFGLERSPDGDLVITLNNGRFSQEIKGAALEAGKWTVVACSVDVPRRKVIANLNGKKVAEIDLPKDFELDVVKSPRKDSDRRWTFTHYGKATMFHGVVDELLIYGRSLNAAELSKVPLRAAPADDAKAAAKKLEGTWVVESVTIGGKETFPPKGTEVIFAGDKMTTKPEKGKERVWKFKIDPSKKPSEIDFEFMDEASKGVVPKGIFELDGDTLKLCTHPTRQTEFSDKAGRLWVLKRKK